MKQKRGLIAIAALWLSVSAVPAQAPQRGQPPPPTVNPSASVTVPGSPEKPVSPTNPAMVPRTTAPGGTTSGNNNTSSNNTSSDNTIGTNLITGLPCSGQGASSTTDADTLPGAVSPPVTAPGTPAGPSAPTSPGASTATTAPSAPNAIGGPLPGSVYGTQGAPNFGAC